MKIATNFSVPTFAIAAALMFPAAAAHADFTGPYAPANATITTSHGGSVDTSSAPASITINGANDESHYDSDQLYGFTIPFAGTLSFDWAYTTFDVDGPSFDPFGYIYNGTFFQLTDDLEVRPNPGASASLLVRAISSRSIKARRTAPMGAPPLRFAGLRLRSREPCPNPPHGH